MEPIKILLAEDNELYRMGLYEVVCDLAGVQVTGVARDGAELLELAASDPPQLVLTDIQMPVMNGIEATRRLLEHQPELGVIALTLFTDERYLVEMLAAGARGYLYKNCTEEEIAEAIEAVHRGDFYQCRSTIQRVSRMLAGSRLIYTFREDLKWSETDLKIIRLACEGYLSKQIAPLLGLSLQTVNQYRSAIIEKAGVKTGRVSLCMPCSMGWFRGEGGLR